MSILAAVIYAAFISLGLPDAVIGAAWPSMAPDLGADKAGAGVLNFIVMVSTILVSFSSGFLIKKFGTYAVCAGSIFLTVVALLGFWQAPNFLWLCLLCVPLGLGGGAIDAALNSYAALYFSSRSMNLLHASWGVGATAGPLIVSMSLAGTGQWRPAYIILAALQACILALLFFTRHLWKTPKVQQVDADAADDNSTSAPWYRIPGIFPALIGFLCYCSFELSTGLWGATYLVQRYELSPDAAAAGAAGFYIGITGGRFVAAFITSWLSNKQLLIGGSVIILAGAATALAIPSPIAAIVGFTTIGIGCAPIYPTTIKETTRRFGAGNTARLMGIQMGFAYTGMLVFPPLVGLAITRVDPVILPLVVLVLASIMLLTFLRLERMIAARNTSSVETDT